MRTLWWTRQDAGRVPITLLEATMVLDETVGRDVEDGVLMNDAYWLERAPPELEWDESEAALVIENVVGRPRMSGYT